MKQREITQLIDGLEDAGARVRRAKSGYFLYLPDGTATSIHLSPSDWRATRNLRSRIERAGMTWPVP